MFVFMPPATTKLAGEVHRRQEGTLSEMTGPSKGVDARGRRPKRRRCGRSLAQRSVAHADSCLFWTPLASKSLASLHNRTNLSLPCGMSMLLLQKLQKKCAAAHMEL